MQPGYILGALWRRKLLSAIGLMVTVGLAVAAGMAVGPTYSAESIVVLIPPTPDQGVKNPYLYLAGLNQARDIVERSLASEEVQKALKEHDARADYTVTEDPMSAGPLLVITTEAATKNQATGTMKALLDTVAPTVQRLQDDLHISPSAQIKTLRITEEKTPKVVRKSQMRAAIVVTAAGLGMSLLLIALVDGLLSRGRKRRKGRGAEEEEPPAEQAQAEPAPSREPAADEPAARQQEVPGRRDRKERPERPERPERQDRPERPERAKGGPRPGPRPVKQGRPNASRAKHPNLPRGEIRK